MRNTYSKEMKMRVVECAREGKTVSALARETGIPRSTIYSWLNQTRDFELPPTVSIKHLQSRIERLERMVEILQTINCRVSDPLQIKLLAMEEIYEDYNVHALCDAMKVSRGTFYNHIKRNKRENTCYAVHREELRGLILNAYDDSNQIFGPAKITAVLRDAGVSTSAETVRELMAEMGLVSIRNGVKKQ